jgi:CheY-like chemotaxis protein
MARLTAHKEKTAIQPRRQSHITIMIVDDEPLACRALTVRLRANHYNTVSACDGYSALALAQNEHPDLILLDLELPAGDGFAVLERLRKFPALAAIPVIVLTGRDPKHYSERALELGAVAFFQKPVENKALLTAIRDGLKLGTRTGLEEESPEPLTLTEDFAH